MSPKKNLEFSERLKRLIYERGLNQRKLSMSIGIASSAITAYVQGRVPESSILSKIAKELNTSMEYLLWGEEMPSPKEPIMSSEEKPIQVGDKDGGNMRSLAHQSVDLVFNSNRPDHQITLLTILRQMTSDLSEIELLRDLCKRK
jgi:transcriptional regulator with XRE-family HTH domain